MRTIAALLFFLLLGTPAYAKPNVVVILTDDQDVTSMPYMPKVQSLLVQHGLTFSNSFVNFPICCPSRVSFLTGEASHNTGIASNSAAYGGGWRSFQSKEARTLPVWLKAAGYRTALVGKYLNEYGWPPLGRTPPDEGLLEHYSKLFQRHAENTPEKIRSSYVPPAPVPPGWDDWFAFVKDRYYQYSVSDNGVLAKFDSQASDYSTDVLRERALRFIGGQAGTETPFFLLLATNAPHVNNVRETAIAAPRHTQLFEDVQLPKTPAFNEQDVSDKPSWLQRRRSLGDAQQAKLTEAYRRELQALQAVDDLVEAVVGGLQAAGKLDDTLIIFTSDNGVLYGDHRLRSKAYAYENSIRVPLVIRGPGVVENQSTDRLVNNLDVTATIEQVADATPDLPADGHSLAPLLVDPNAPWRSALLIEGGVRQDADQVFSGVRTPTRKYVLYGSGFEELYDLEHDPYELENKANTPGYAEDLTALRKLQEQLRDCKGTSCWIQ